ncbi:uncharacterized protein LOC132699607 isoform X1 [Cylas formicarius]|uniref:uncharacterized protein LOC132699607 isoform X1 n=1 Tax=Cylas formicarius TaxID=197179 RepID=UPI002958A8E0|nr:uncharacterized protein LOC132699607 isoform X1 [Cylas formicarius]
MENSLGSSLSKTTFDEHHVDTTEKADVSVPLSQFHSRNIAELFLKNPIDESSMVTLEKLHNGEFTKPGNGTELSFASSEVLIIDHVATCRDFLDIVTFAKKLLREVFKDSQKLSKPENDEADSSADSADFSVADIYFSGWPTVGTFSAEIGCDKIEEYLASFFTDEDWTFAVHYNGSQDKPTSCLHNYEAIFGLPTASYPIPQATASVYFTIEVSRIQPPQCLVDVTFTYETSRRINRPGVHDFHEKWLLDILEAKIKFFQTITY